MGRGELPEVLWSLAGDRCDVRAGLLGEAVCVEAEELHAPLGPPCVRHRFLCLLDRDLLGEDVESEKLSEDRDPLAR
jgi:hypothetical protein